MKNNADKELLTLLVRVYNHSIQYYYHFPEVIIYGNRRLEAEEFNRLLHNGLITPYYTDSFGKLYHLSKKGEEVLHCFSHTKKRRAIPIRSMSSNQSSLQLF
jgi:hypothetical protein